MINASIITIGDELLIGQVIDTNSAFIAQEMNKAGFAIKNRIAVGDDYNDICNALNEAKKHTDIILITGGLGPTADDITKPLLCNYFGGKMILNQEVYNHIKHLFEDILKRPFTDRNKKQAEVPDVCSIVPNEIGTAPGMLFTQQIDGIEKTFISMPGVPQEMKLMVKNTVIDLLKNKYKTDFIAHRTLLTSGIGESTIADMLIDFESNLPSKISLAYLPNYGQVRLRLTATSNNEIENNNAIDLQFKTLQKIMQEHLVSNTDEPMEIILGKLLQQRNETLCTAESCTGGYMAHLITSIPGSSAFYDGSVISYSYKAKEDLLQVKNETLKTYGAVSEEVVKEMAQGALQHIGTTYAIAVSGIMGPDGGMQDKPVGTVWVCVGNKENLIAQKFKFRYDRQLNIKLTAVNAFDLLRKFILDKS